MEKNNEDPLTNSLLPNARMPWRSLLTSIVVQLTIFVTLAGVSAFVVKKIDIEGPNFHVTLIKNSPLSWKHRNTRTSRPVAPAFHPAEILPPKIFNPVPSEPIRSSLHHEEITKPELESSSPNSAALAIVPDTPPIERPREPVQTGSFTAASLGPMKSSDSHGDSRGQFIAASALDTGLTEEVAGSGRNRGPLKTGLFEEPAHTQVTPGPKAESPDMIPVEIKYKPQPAYTPEARTKLIEGEVVLEVIFGSSGVLTVNRVVTGLGYGLDESAEEAARKIQFVPATLRDGRTVDTKARLRVRFQLAS